MTTIQMPKGSLRGAAGTSLKLSTTDQTRLEEIKAFYAELFGRTPTNNIIFHRGLQLLRDHLHLGRLHDPTALKRSEAHHIERP